MAYAMPGKTPTTSSRPSMSGVEGKKSSSDRSWIKGLITLVVVLVIIGGGLYVIISGTGLTSLFSSRAGLVEKWQAVFLSNNQVYFGQVEKVTKDFVILKDIYYLQVVNQPLQRSQEGDQAAVGDQKTEQRLTLIKLGNEIHGPKDEMILNRDHVVLMEDLKSDSQVVKAINDYVASQTK